MMAPPRKEPDTEAERLKLQKRREQYKRRYEKNKEGILAKNRLAHEKNKEKWNKSKSIKQKAVRSEVKIKKNAYNVVVPAITPTLEALGGHFSGDGCCLSDSRCLSVFTMDRDTAAAYEGMFGGSIQEQSNGFYWRTNAGVFGRTCELLTPFAWTKAPQLIEAIKTDRNNDLVRSLKTSDTLGPSICVEMDDLTFDKVVAGFFTADGHCTNRHANLRAYVVFGQKLRGILDCIASRYPGASAINPYTPTANGSKTSRVTGEEYNAFQMTYSGENAVKLLERIYPWIVAERVKKSVKKTLDLHENPSV